MTGEDGQDSYDDWRCRGGEGRDMGSECGRGGIQRLEKTMGIKRVRGIAMTR